MDYKIIATDDHVYGPVDVDTLRQWVADGRVDAQTWIHEIGPDRWQHASQVPALSDLFRRAAQDAGASSVAEGSPAVRPGQLRRLKVFSEMSEEQLALFVSLVERLSIKTGYIIVKQSEPGDCMYLILDGEVRVRQGKIGNETVLATLETGDFFGEICLFDEGPRSADVVANKDCTLLKITKPIFRAIMEQHPDVAVRFLFAIIRTVESRIRTQNKKYSDSMSASRSWNISASMAATASGTGQRHRL